MDLIGPGCEVVEGVFCQRDRGSLRREYEKEVGWVLENMLRGKVWRGVGEIVEPLCESWRMVVELEKILIDGGDWCG